MIYPNIMINNDKRILIVDDDVELRTNLAEILADDGFQTATAANGPEALEQADAGFDVILLDQMMPGMTGLEVLSELKKTAPASKIIMITAFATIDNAVQAIRSGASDYLAKPFLIDNLLISIKRILEEARFEKNTLKLDMDYVLGSLANPIRRKIISLLSTYKEIRLMDLTRELKINDHTKVIFHLKTLKESHIINQNKDKSYTLTKEGLIVLTSLTILEKHLQI